MQQNWSTFFGSFWFRNLAKKYSKGRNAGAEIAEKLRSLKKTWSVINLKCEEREKKHLVEADLIFLRLNLTFCLCKATSIFDLISLVRRRKNNFHFGNKEQHLATQNVVVGDKIDNCLRKNRWRRRFTFLNCLKSHFRTLLGW